MSVRYVHPELGRYLQQLIIVVGDTRRFQRVAPLQIILLLRKIRHIWLEASETEAPPGRIRSSADQGLGTTRWQPETTFARQASDSRELLSGA